MDKGRVIIMNMRTGIGYDMHQLVKGEKLIIGGIEVPSSSGSLGHSDGDCLIHSIVDAILGATALGDIGVLFPSTNDQYKDCLLYTSPSQRDRG